jgi:hypothetical protein
MLQLRTCGKCFHKYSIFQFWYSIEFYNVAFVRMIVG